MGQRVYRVMSSFQLIVPFHRFERTQNVRVSKWKISQFLLDTTLQLLNTLSSLLSDSYLSEACGWDISGVQAVQSSTHTLCVHEVYHIHFQITFVVYILYISHSLWISSLCTEDGERQFFACVEEYAFWQFSHMYTYACFVDAPFS